MTQQPDPKFSFKSVAWKASTDMLAAIIVGAGLGIFVDQTFDVYPWGLIVGFLLGSAAGLLNVYRGLCKIGYGFNSKAQTDKKGKDGQPPSSV